MPNDGTAESSPAPTPDLIPAVTPAEQAIAKDDVAGFREARLAARTGKTPDVPADSSPAQPAEQATSTEVTEAASEAAKPRKNAEDRIKELLAKEKAATARAEAAERRIQEAETARNQPKQDERTEPESRPAPAKLTYPPELLSYDAYAEKNPEATYDEYQDARTDFRWQHHKAADDQERQLRDHQQRRSESERQRVEQFTSQISDAKKADPEFLNTLSDAVKGLKPFAALERQQDGRLRDPETGRYVLPGYAAITEEILSSPVAAQMMRHFTDHPEDLDRIAKLPSSRAMLKAFGKIEARYEKQDSETETPPKPVTSAPRPPTTLGSRPSAPADPIEAAVRNDDVRAFREERLRQKKARLAS